MQHSEHAADQCYQSVCLFRLIDMGAHVVGRIACICGWKKMA